MFCQNEFWFPQSVGPLRRKQKSFLQNEIWFRGIVQTIQQNENSFRRNDFSFLQNFIMICCCQNHLVVDGDDGHAEATTAERIEKDLGPRVGHTDRRGARSAAANRLSSFDISFRSSRHLTNSQRQFGPMNGLPPGLLGTDNPRPSSRPSTIV